MQGGCGTKPGSQTAEVTTGVERDHNYGSFACTDQSDIGDKGSGSSS